MNLYALFQYINSLQYVFHICITSNKLLKTLCLLYIYIQFLFTFFLYLMRTFLFILFIAV